MKYSWIILLLLCADRLAAQSVPATQGEAGAIRSEMQQMREDYERRMQALDKRLQQLEATNSVTNAATNTVTNAPTVAAAATDTNAIAQAAAQRDFVEQQFQKNTETREWALAQERNQPLKERLEHVANNFVDIGGYFRAGYGRDDQGGPQPAFQAPGAFAKYRLGNEAENYGELIFSKDWYAPELFKSGSAPPPDGTPTGPIARTQVRLALYDPNGSSGSSTSLQTTLPEAWAEIGNVVASAPSLKFWGGARFYRRQDIHIDDFFFYNMSGTGGGFEDLQLPFGKLALAWIGNGVQSGIYSSDIAALPAPNNLAGFSKQSFDLSLYEVPAPLGQAEFGLVGSVQKSGLDSQGQQAADSHGVSFNFIHSHEHFLSDDGINKFSLQFGTGAAKTFTSGFETVALTNGTFIVPDQRNSWRFRATESFVAQPWEHLSISPAVVYQYTDYDDAQGRVQWFSAGVRPIYHFDRYFSLAFEGGADYVEDSALSRSGTLLKATLAPQVSLGDRFLSRPVIRAFVTYAKWSDDFRGTIGGNDYANKTSGWTWGFQMETWW